METGRQGDMDRGKRERGRETGRVQRGTVLERRDGEEERGGEGVKRR